MRVCLACDERERVILSCISLLWRTSSLPASLSLPPRNVQPCLLLIMLVHRRGIRKLPLKFLFTLAHIVPLPSPSLPHLQKTIATPGRGIMAMDGECMCAMFVSGGREGKGREKGACSTLTTHCTQQHRSIHPHTHTLTTHSPPLPPPQSPTPPAARGWTPSAWRTPRTTGARTVSC
jgi:hypothetical protein